MRKALVFTASPRKGGNSTIMAEFFSEGFRESNSGIEIFDTEALNLEYCRGCLRCNVLGRCSITTDEWQAVSDKIALSDVLVFASPVYFHHLAAPMKKLVDRFRSLVKVRITETGLEHIPVANWNKELVLLLSMGSPNPAEAQQVIDLFEFICTIMGTGNKLHVILATRMALSGQLLYKSDRLERLYQSMGLPQHLVLPDMEKNRQTVLDCNMLGNKLGKKQD